MKSSVGERLYFFDDEELGIKRSEQGLQRHIDRYQRAIELCASKGGLWLDAACGSGYGTQLISKVADYAVGIDVDPITISYARKHYGSSNIQFQVGDINNLEFGSMLFDVIISVETIEHVADCTPFLRKGYMILKPGGVMVISTPISKPGGQPNPHHLNEFTKDSFINLTSEIFDETDYVIDEPVVFTTGELTEQIFGVCKKERCANN